MLSVCRHSNPDIGLIRVQNSIEEVLPFATGRLDDRQQDTLEAKLRLKAKCLVHRAWEEVR